MTDTEIADYLEDNGYPPHIVRGGREGLIRRWSEFVAEVENGYIYGLDDYRHDIDLRGAIEVTGLKDHPAVRDADERLRPLLSGSVRVWESVDGDAFWDFGYPRNAKRLVRDLRASGLIEAD
jgi:hypothetical protein